MVKYSVIVTRDITESTVIEVEAESLWLAEDLALIALGKQTDTKWELDDGSWDTNSPYVTDVSVAD
jgi:hypothetical protein